MSWNGIAKTVFKTNMATTDSGGDFLFLVGLMLSSLDVTTTQQMGNVHSSQCRLKVAV